MDKIKVYYLGSGDIAVAPLAKLYSSEKIDLVGIGTQPDRPAGRKKVMTPTPVGIWCDSQDIKIDKPANVNASEFLAKLADLAPDVILVVSFGQLLKKEILDLPKIACVNIHASLLPKYRGASPIAAALFNEDKETGLTIMKMDEGLDTGPEYCKFVYEIGNEKADELESKLSELGANHIEETLIEIVTGVLKPIPQKSEGASYAGKIKKSDGIIDWNNPASKIIAQIRAFHPWPGAFFTYYGSKQPMKLTITSAEVIPDNDDLMPGKTILADKTGWIIKCGKDALSITTIKPAGKAEMTASEFVRGRPELREK